MIDLRAYISNPSGYAGRRDCGEDDEYFSKKDGMRVNVQLFSFLRDCLPVGTERGRVTVELPAVATLFQLFEHLDLRRCLGGEFDSEKFNTSWQVSVNGEFVFALDGLLKEGDQVLVFPHIAGG